MVQNCYRVFGKNGGVLGNVLAYSLTDAEFRAFREFGSQFNFVQLLI